MMYRARIDAVNGLRVLADGKWLICIGNAPVKVGDRVWTDGRCIYGNHRVSQQPFVPVPIKDDLVIPIMYQDKAYGYYALSHLRDKGSLLPIQNDSQLTLPNRYYFTAGSNEGQKSFAAVDVYSIHPNSTRVSFGETPFDVTMTRDGSIYTSFVNQDYGELGRCVLKNDVCVWTPDKAIGAFFPDYSKPLLPWNNTEDIELPITLPALDYIHAFTICTDIDGNFYCLAVVGTAEKMTEVTYPNYNQEPSSYLDEGSYWLFIQNDECSLMHKNILTTFGMASEAEAAGFKPVGTPTGTPGIYYIGEEATTSFEPYSLYLPCKNEGKGGWYSFDCTFSRTASYNTYGFFCKGMKFFNRTRDKMLFELSADDIKTVGLALEEYNSIPYVDFCKLGTDDYLVLIRAHTVLVDVIFTWTHAVLLRYKNKKLSIVQTNIEPAKLSYMCAVCTAPKRKWCSAANKLSVAMLENDPIIVI